MRQSPPHSPRTPESMEEREAIAQARDYIRYLEDQEQRAWATRVPPPAPGDQDTIDHNAKMTAFADARAENLDRAGLDAAFEQLDPDHAGHIGDRERIGRYFYLAGAAFENVQTHHDLIADGTDEVHRAPFVDPTGEMAHMDAARRAGMMRDPRIRSMAWHALNPNQPAEAPVPADFVVPDTFGQEAENFLYARQAYARRAMLIAIAEGAGREASGFWGFMSKVPGLKKKKWVTSRANTFDIEQGLAMLRDIRDTLTDDEYDALHSAIYEEDPATLSPNLLNARADLQDEVIDAADAYKSSRQALLTKAGQEAMAAEEARIARLPAGEQEAARAAAKRRIGAVAILGSIQNFDEDMERRKREQFAPYESEQSILFRGFEWWNRKSEWQKILWGGVITSTAAAAGTAFFFPSLVVASGGFAAFLAARGARTGISSAVGFIARGAWNPRIQRAHERQQEELWTGARTKAERDIRTAMNFPEIVSLMEADAAQYRKDMEKLKDRQWAKRLGINLGIGVAAGLGTALTMEITAGLSGGGSASTAAPGATGKGPLTGTPPPAVGPLPGAGRPMPGAGSSLPPLGKGGTFASTLPGGGGGPAASGAAILEMKPGTGASPEGLAIQHLRSLNIDKIQAGKMAHLMWLDHAKQTLQNKALVEELQRLGYLKPGANLDEQIRAYGRAMHNIQGGKVKFEVDATGKPIMKLEDMKLGRPRGGVVEHQPAGARPRRPTASHNPIRTGRRYGNVDYPAANRSGFMNAEPTRAPDIIDTGYNHLAENLRALPESGGMRGNFASIKALKGSVFLAETERLAKLGPDAPPYSEFMPQAFQAGWLQRYEGIAGRLQSGIRKFRIPARELSRLSVEELYAKYDLR